MAKLVRLHHKVEIPYGYDIKSSYLGVIEKETDQYKMEFPTEGEYYEYLREEAEEKKITM